MEGDLLQQALMPRSPKNPDWVLPKVLIYGKLILNVEHEHLHEEKLELGSETNDLDLSDEIKDVYADVLEITNTFYHQLP